MPHGASPCLWNAWALPYTWQHSLSYGASYLVFFLAFVCFSFFLCACFALCKCCLRFAFQLCHAHKRPGNISKVVWFWNNDHKRQQACGEKAWHVVLRKAELVLKGGKAHGRRQFINEKSPMLPPLSTDILYHRMECNEIHHKGLYCYRHAPILLLLQSWTKVLENGI